MQLLLQPPRVHTSRVCISSCICPIKDAHAHVHGHELHAGGHGHELHAGGHGHELHAGGHGHELHAGVEMLSK
jgi:hypothetical protein